MSHLQQTNHLLGFSPDARLLIINADDFGMCHAVNQAIITTLQQGIVRSTTLMVPCAWALHAMHFLAAHPDIPFGIHLTVISEWGDYRWGPVSCREKVSSLLDEAGYFYNFDQMPQFFAQVKLDHLEIEFRAQIEVVLNAGLRPTHLDWHCLRLNAHNDIWRLLLRLAREYGLALRVMGRAWIEHVQSQGWPCNDYDFLDSYQIDPATKADCYVALLRNLPVGLSEWAVHPGLAHAELLAIERECNHIRQTDFDFLTSQQAKDVIEEEGIVLLDYQALQHVWLNK